MNETMILMGGIPLKVVVGPMPPGWNAYLWDPEMEATKAVITDKGEILIPGKPNLKCLVGGLSEGSGAIPRSGLPLLAERKP